MQEIPGLGRSPGVGHDNKLQYSCLENSMNREAWRARVHRVTKSDTTEQPIVATCINNLLIRKQQQFLFLYKLMWCYSMLTECAQF